MERFAFKIDAALRANLYKICRLCGIDNPSKVPILPMESEIIDLDEPSLSQKVYELVGFTVSQDDKMPQTMCSLCVDKINDFFEFREMCHATNKQTRKLLGLKQADPQTLMDVKPIFKSEPLPTGNKRGRKRKTDDNAKPTNSSELSLDAVKHEPVAWRKKQRLQQQQLLPASKTEIKEEPTDADGSLLGKKRRKASCSVCSERFASKEEAEEHRAAAHVPSIARYSCYACNQTHHNASDIKAHQLWHKLSKTPYQCPQCNASVANNYAFTRHLREHTPTTPIGLLVLDRECPLCKKTFLTNYFYNTHPCARRTRKCGGCSRALNTEVAYMRHAPHCPKIYLSHSKHIMPEVADHEAQMRIKNEYDVDNEESPAIENAAQSDMQPVVVLERLTSPLLRASLEPNSLGRNNERVSTKSYLKRVDQLLKNTMSTLVSIKHEPEVHIDDTGPQLQPVVEPTESEPDEEPPADYDDFRNDDSDDDESAAATAPDDDAPATAADDEAPAAATAADDDAPPADAPTVAVKQEIIDEAYEQQQLGDGVQIKQEPLKLKLKITKNHGQLNSSIVDDDDNDLQLQSKSAKKKKKRKHKERYRESEEATPSAENADNAAEMPASSSAMVTIKQERVDENYEDVAQQAEFEPQATVMTSIPMLQLESSSFTEEQPAATSSSREPETEDVKPNRLELDRLMQITHIASGVAMAEEAMPPENAVEAVPNEAPAENVAKTARKSTSAKSTARKSTGGMSRAATSSSSTPAVEMQLPQIVAVESGATMPFNIAIKPEPLNRGYADEHGEQTEQEQMTEATSEINHNEKVDEEAAYINNLDLSNVVIKQEKDLHISDVDINGSEADNLQCNGSRASEESDDDDDDDDDSASSADEAEENMDTYEEQDERIYQEIELPPLEEQAAVENAEVEEPCESEHMQVEPENTSVLEEASERTQEQLQDPPVQPQVAEAEKLESQPMQVESEAENENVENENEENVEGTASTAVEATAILESSAEEEKSIAAEETPPAAQPEPEVAASSAPVFNFVITSVCSQAEETLPVDEPQTPEKSSHSEENVTCPEVNLSAPKESETLAQPFFDPSSTSTNYNCDEEQQNVLNHELSATEQAEEQLALPAVEEQQEMEAGTSSATPSCSENASSANEETENRINEQQQEHQRHERQQQQQRCEINDDSNINEIAENNNNANIERELNDDANVAPQENPNI
ncbi:nucleolar protein dao-5 [Drosophila nasuta]|uniref:nucleolar protein dao-5 n=1 Tax=Drosophila nasuta TaxID=42062 RepID=UPI00295EEFD8|nr:nucleolar protein dao-5 [Drosophila nasuta]